MRGVSLPRPALRRNDLVMAVPLVRWDAMPTDTVRALRHVALAEATTFLMLLVASYVKHQGDGELGVSILGPIHGVLFIVYVLLALRVRERMRWSNATTFWVLAGAVVPFGGYVVDRWLVQRAARSDAPARAE
jgi:integral membrane protein